MATKSWGSTEGKAKSNKFDYMSMSKNGSYNVRIISGVLARYVYWLENKALNTTATFDVFNFDREREVFDSSLPDPIREMKITQFNKWSKKEEQVKSSKNYLCWVIDRDDNDTLKLMTVKNSLFDSIKSLMRQLGKNGLNSPSDIDLVITKSGERMTTKYEIDLFQAIQSLEESKNPDSELSKRLERDSRILGTPIKDEDGDVIGYSEVTDLEDAFPAPFKYDRSSGVPMATQIAEAAEAQRAAVTEYLAKVKEDTDGSDNKHADSAKSSAMGAEEAAQDL